MPTLVQKILFNGRFAVIFCMAYAACMLLFTIAPGDGTWSLYANQIIQGQRLYSDLHLNQQPLFPLFVSAITLIAGEEILSQKLLFFIVPALYIFLLYRIATCIAKNDLSRGFIVVALFFIAITFEAYRFDDYHVFSGVLILASLYLSIKFSFNESSLKKYILLQSLIIALLLNIRVNDGFFIAMAVVSFGLSKIGFSRQLLFGVISSLVFFALVLTNNLFILDDSYVAWYKNTLISAAQIKGGMALIWYPFTMLKNSILFFLHGQYSYRRILFAVFSLTLLHVSIKRSSGAIRVGSIAFSLTSFSYCIFKIFPQHMVTICVALGVITSFLITSYFLIIKITKSRIYFSDGFVKFSPLIFYPFFLYCSGSLSSAGSFNDHFFPLATLLIVLLLIFRDAVAETTLLKACKYIVLFMFLLLTCDAISLRTMRPYGWHSYNVPSFFERRIYVNDAIHGPHLLSKDLANLIIPVCTQIKDTDELLSIPFSFANYYCHKNPWKNYIQTFFDTSSPQVIDKLMQDITYNPPKYIFYQRQLINLAVHERLFNHGEPLRQRALDELIMNNIEIKKWEVVYTSDLYPPSVWFLIKTK